MRQYSQVLKWEENIFESDERIKIYLVNEPEISS